LCIEDLCIGEAVAISVAAYTGVRALYNLVTGQPLSTGVVQDAQAGLLNGVLVAAGGLFGGASAAAGGGELPTVSNPALQRTMNALYKATDEIPGGTAGAIRNEALTGQPTNGVWHLQAGIERMTNLQKILKTQGLNATDRATAERELAKLRDAVRFAREQTVDR
jgi:hypothetical protein